MNNVATLSLQEKSRISNARSRISRTGRRVRGICRPAAASPAVGWGAWHAKEEEALLRAAVDLARPGSLEAAQ